MEFYQMQYLFLETGYRQIKQADFFFLPSKMSIISKDLHKKSITQSLDTYGKQNKCTQSPHHTLIPFNISVSLFFWKEKGKENVSLRAYFLGGKIRENGWKT